MRYSRRPPVAPRRIHNVLKGIPDDRDGLFDTIQRSKNHYQKRAYQCIKCMVALFSNCSVAYQILQVRRRGLDVVGRV